MLTKLRALIARFRADHRAAAAVEFALIVPVLITLYFGSMEASALFTVDKRINTVSATVGDLVAQWDAKNDGSIGTTTTLTDYMAAATGIVYPYSATGIKIVISLVEVKSDGTTKVLWSQANSNATARTANSTFSPLAATTTMNSVSRGGCVVAAEVSMPYKPLLGAVFKVALNLSHTNYFLPRFGSNPPINLSTTSLAATACTA